MGQKNTKSVDIFESSDNFVNMTSRSCWVIAFNMVGKMFGVSTIISWEGGFDEAHVVVSRM